MPFRLTNTPSIFQCFMNNSLARLEELCGVYLDNIIMYIRCVLQHLGYLCTVLSRLQDCMLYVQRPKCDFVKRLLHFLGHVISPAWMAPDPSKVSTIHDMAAPTDASHFYSLLGCTDFYERFSPQYTTICAPLTDLLGSHVEWCWGPP